MRAALALVAAAILLTGCTSTSTPEPTASPTPTPTVAAIAPGTVVATGSFSGQATGKVELVALERGMFEVRLSDFATEVASPFSLLLSPYPLTADRTCLDLFAFDLGDPTVNGPGPYPVGDFADWFHDPSFLDGAALGQYIEADATDSDCLRSVVATAPFTWDFPDLRPGLAVIDFGTALYATGEVTVKNGEPVSYVVASGDILGEIAARFGLTTEDLNYLNPARTGPGSDAVAGEILNLSRADR